MIFLMIDTVADAADVVVVVVDVVVDVDVVVVYG